MNYGLIIEPPLSTDYVLGGAVSLGGEVLQPDGQWDNFLPETEIQNRNGVETYSCVSFATLNCIEILERKEFGARSNWSERFLAKESGTQEKQGNTPNRVAETRRKKGCVKENEWAFDSFVKTFAEYYAEIPHEIETLALGEGAEYDFGYEAVRVTTEGIKEALKYSPVLFSVYAWVKNENGMFYRPQGMTDNHATCVYGYEEGKYWKCYDSYLDDGMILKQIKWDALPMMCMRYTLHKQVVVQNWWNKFIAQLKELLGFTTFGVARSAGWAQDSRNAIKEAGNLCQFGMHKPTLLNRLSTHHILSFHEHPELERESSNWIVLCWFHHFWHAHFGNWRMNNPNIVLDARIFTDEIKAHKLGI